MPVPFVTVDAFTSLKFRGNPAAVVLIPPGAFHGAGGIGAGGIGAPAAGVCVDGFPPDQFLAYVAKEMNLSETAFVVQRAASRGGDGDGDGGGAPTEFDLRWFTPSGTEAGADTRSHLRST
jgi:predicted PhzF superfamily epimerase YddE/YHI9